MKLGKLIIEIRRAGGAKLAEEVFDTLTDPEGEARKVIAKMARSAAKDFVQTYCEKIIEDFTAELEKRKAAILAELGSAVPASPSTSDVSQQALKYVTGAYSWGDPKTEGERP